MYYKITVHRDGFLSFFSLRPANCSVNVEITSPFIPDRYVKIVFSSIGISLSLLFNDLIPFVQEKMDGLIPLRLLVMQFNDYQSPIWKLFPSMDVSFIFLLCTILNLLFFINVLFTVATVIENLFYSSSSRHFFREMKLFTYNSSICLSSLKQLYTLILQKLQFIQI